MNRIIMHWTAGRQLVSASDRKHYHAIVDGAGNWVKGDKPVSTNESTRDGDYVAHTRGLNTGSIGLAMSGMAGAQERPFNAGRFPLTDVQVKAFVELVAAYATAYDIEVTCRTVLTHAEVQPTLGVAQRGKWDITWLPGMSEPGDPIEVGDTLRHMILNVQSN